MNRVRLTAPKRKPRVRLDDAPAADELSDPVLDYAQAVLRGDEVAGPHVRAACSRHIKDLEHAKDRGLTFDLKKANAVISFFEKRLHLSGGQFEGEPFRLHPCQKFIVGSLFGWLRADGTRRFRRAYIEQGKGNGKSPLIAGIGLYGMCSDSEPGAEIYAAGSSMDQSRVLFNDAVRMVEQAPTLKKKVTVHGRKRVDKLSMPKGAFFIPLSRETRRRGSGPRPHMALCDEVHEYHDRMTIDLLERGFKSRRQPLLIMITNSGTDRNSVCYEEHCHAVKVAHGDIEDDASFSYVCSLDEKDDPINDPSCWKKANPLLGQIITEEYLAGVTKQARDIPGKLNGILRLHFCVWTDAETAWISREVWSKCEDPTLNIDAFVGRRCFAGLDLGETKSLTGKALVFEDGYTDDGKPRFVAFVHGYTPRDTLHSRAEADRAPYDVWVREGYLTATPGPVIRNDFVARDLVEDSKRFDLAVVAYDKWLWKDFTTALGDLGAELPTLEHGQSFQQRRGCEPDCDKRHEHVPAPLWMLQSITDFETLILERRIRIHINPALRSGVASARFHISSAGLRRFEKQSVGGRIDLCVALTMAVGAAVRSAPPSMGYVNLDDLVVM